MLSVIGNASFTVVEKWQCLYCQPNSTGAEAKMIAAADQIRARNPDAPVFLYWQVCASGLEPSTAAANWGSDRPLRNTTPFPHVNRAPVAQHYPFPQCEQGAPRQRWCILFDWRTVCR